MRLSSFVSRGCRLKAAFLLGYSSRRLILIIPQIWQPWCCVWKWEALEQKTERGRDEMNFTSLLPNRNGRKRNVSCLKMQEAVKLWNTTAGNGSHVSSPYYEMLFPWGFCSCHVNLPLFIMCIFPGKMFIEAEALSVEFGIVQSDGSPHPLATPPKLSELPGKRGSIFIALAMVPHLPVILISI